MSKNRLTNFVGILSVTVGTLWIFTLIVLPAINWIMEPDAISFVGFIFLALPISIPAALAIYNGHQLTRHISRDNIKRTVGCLCIVITMFGTSSLLSLVPMESEDIWNGWGFFAAMVFGIAIYAALSRKLLQHEGFETEIAEFFGEGQLFVLAWLLYMALTSIQELPFTGSASFELVSIFWPIVAAMLFFKIGKRLLRRQSMVSTHDR